MNKQPRKSIPRLQADPFKHDPIEDDPVINPLIIAATEEARAELVASGEGLGFGSCHSLWRIKQRILKDKYQIEWKSPGEMNPGCVFD